VGLKLFPADDLGLVDDLSAEPLVGLKPQLRDARGEAQRPFSRTPRGFEAQRRVGDRDRDLPFSRTPRGFEAI